MTLGEKIAKQRKSLNYTQEQLADILGVSRQSISKWESDIAYPETEKLIELGKLFDCSMDYLLKDDITEKGEVQTFDFIESIGKNVMAYKNRSKVKKILKIIGIILAVVLTVDIISMILYFLVLGIPN